VVPGLFMFELHSGFLEHKNKGNFAQSLVVYIYILTFFHGSILFGVRCSAPNTSQGVGPTANLQYVPSTGVCFQGMCDSSRGSGSYKWCPARAAWFYEISTMRIVAAVVGILIRVVLFLHTDLCYSFPDPPSTAPRASGGGGFF
jgi:hypothetical protein